ncbi:hypothetical protein Peur_013626 [Populus x canadensis]
MSEGFKTGLGLDRLLFRYFSAEGPDLGFNPSIDDPITLLPLSVFHAAIEQEIINKLPVAAAAKTAVLSLNLVGRSVVVMKDDIPTLFAALISKRKDDATSDFEICWTFQMLLERQFDRQ